MHVDELHTMVGSCILLKFEISKCLTPQANSFIYVVEPHSVQLLDTNQVIVRHHVRNTKFTVAGMSVQQFSAN